MSKHKVLPASLQGKLLQAILEFMVRAGANEADIRSSFAFCLQRLTIRNGVSSPNQEGKYVGNGNVSAELIRLWHRDSRYIDRDARPKPLLLRKGPYSLVATIARLDPDCDADLTVASMLSAGLLRKLASGKYVPRAESVTIDSLHPLAVEHVAKSVIRLVSTVRRNTDPLRQSLPLIERYAYVPDLSRSERLAFAEFTRTQGMAYLESVDDWLEQRRARRAGKASPRMSSEGVTAGVHLVAYLGDELNKKMRLSQSRSKRENKRITRNQFSKEAPKTSSSAREARV